MQIFQDIFETRKRSFINAFSICMTVPLKSKHLQRSLLITELKYQITSIRSSHRRCSVKKVLLKISQILQKNSCVGVSFLLHGGNNTLIVTDDD